LCGFDSEYDALVPAQVVVTNTTQSFHSKVGVDFISTNPEFNWEVDYSSGPQCEGQNADSGSALIVVSTRQLPPGQSMSTQFFFALKHYYTPANPGGDTNQLNGLIGIEGQETVGATSWKDQLTGPAATKDVFAADMWTFALSGQTPGSTTSATPATTATTTTTMTSSATSNGARTELGSLDVDGYCQSIGAGDSSLSEPQVGPGDATNNWICTGSGAHVDMNAACQENYPGQSTYAQATDPDDAYSWVCY